MTDETRPPAPAPEAPRLHDPVAAGSPGASDATLIIFLGGVMLLLLLCVGFILAAS